MADISRSDQFLFKGPSEIMNTLSSLPATEHDPFSFQVDLMSYTVCTELLIFYHSKYSMALNK